MPEHSTHHLPSCAPCLWDAERSSWGFLYFLSCLPTLQLPGDSVPHRWRASWLHGCLLSHQCFALDLRKSFFGGTGLNKMRTLKAASDSCDCPPKELHGAAVEGVPWGYAADVMWPLSRCYYSCGISSLGWMGGTETNNELSRFSLKVQFT